MWPEHDPGEAPTWQETVAALVILVVLAGLPFVVGTWGWR